jgi:hypothetical protein
MKVLHRIDDVYACRPDLMRVLACCERYDVPAILGVIPKRLTADMAIYLAMRQRFAVYQHGHEHRSWSTSGRKDEFPATRDAADIEIGIRTGRQLVETAIGRPVNGYIPPWNTASAPLVKVLIALGFTHVSANHSASIPAPLIHRPCHVDALESYAPVKARSAEGLIRHVETEVQSGEPVVCIVHHIKDLGEQGMRDAEAVIAWSRAHRMPDDAWRVFAGQVPTSAA